MTTSGTDILASEYVTIQDKAQSLLGTGSATRGYGQPLQSSDVFSGNQITKAQWDALRYDVTSIRYHQDGILPTIVTVNVGDPIGYGSGSPNNNYDTLLETGISNRFRVATEQSVVSSVSNQSTTTTWNTLAECTLTATFSNSNEARYFFNSGGKIRMTTALTGYSSTAQNNAWANILNSIGSRDFGADTDPFVNYYTLTNTPQAYYQNTLSTPYSANNFRLYAWTDVSDNSSGTASVLYLKVSLDDAYVDPDITQGYPAGFTPPTGYVDGTLSVNVEEIKATGPLFPSGTFTITSPSYSISSFSLT